MNLYQLVGKIKILEPFECCTCRRDLYSKFEMVRSRLKVFGRVWKMVRVDGVEAIFLEEENFSPLSSDFHSRVRRSLESNSNDQDPRLEQVSKFKSQAD